MYLSLDGHENRTFPLNFTCDCIRPIATVMVYLYIFSITASRNSVVQAVAVAL